MLVPSITPDELHKNVKFPADLALKRGRARSTQHLIISAVQTIPRQLAVGPAAATPNSTKSRVPRMPLSTTTGPSLTTADRATQSSTVNRRPAMQLLVT
jgi:hypothetical protein